MRLSLSMLLRDWRSGELRVLATATVMAVAIASSLMLLTERLDGGIRAQGNRLLAADRLLRSTRPAPEAWLRAAAALGLRHARSAQAPSMLFTERQSQLAVVRGVSQGWPLRGEAVLRRALGAPDERLRAAPVAGEVWVEPRLLSLLDLTLGDTVEVGELELRVGAVLVSEPDRSTGLFPYGPRVLLHWQDFLRAGLSGEGARVRHDALFAGGSSALADFRDWLTPRLQPADRWLDLDSARPPAARMLTRAQDYLGLCGAVAVLLSGLAISLAARRYSERQRDYVAMMKVFGVPFRIIATLYLELVAWLWLCTTVLGFALAWGLQALLFWTLGELLPFAPGATGWQPWLYAAAVSLTCLAVFALPPLLGLRGTAPLLALRRDLPFSASHVPAWVMGMAIVGLLAYSYLQHGVMAIALLVAVLALFIGLGVVAAALLLAGHGVGMQAGGLWRLAFANLRRARVRNLLLTGLFGLLLSVSFIAWLLRGSLLEDWRASLPPGTPNHLLMNVATEELGALRESLADAGMSLEHTAPMANVQLVSIDGRPVTGSRDDGSRRRRDFNFSWSDELPPGNVLAAGEWWPPDGPAAISVERELAERLNVGPGSRMGFQMADERVDVPVANVRDVDWNMMRPNFLLLFSPAAVRGVQPRWLGAFYAPPSAQSAITDISRKFRTVTLVAMTSALEEMSRVLNRLGNTVSLVLAATMLSAGLALAIVVRASMDERLGVSALLRALGASRRRLMGSMAVEFAAIGIVAGLLATIAAELAFALLQRYMLEIELRWHPWLWLLGPLAGTALVTAFGLLSSWRVVRVSPLSLLRDE